MPGIRREDIIGVRVPVLRAYAKEFVNTAPHEEFIKEIPHRYYDENLLHGMIISQMKDYERCINELEQFLPYVDNWAVCDTISPKCFRKNKKHLLSVVKTWLQSKEVYRVRFGIKTLMNEYLEEDFDKEYLSLVSNVQSEEYYINMMIAWYFATALAKQWEDAIIYLEERKLSVWVHKKTIQKAIESYRITPEQKTYLRSLKINK